MYCICILFMLLVMVFFSVLYDNKKLEISADRIEDGLIISLLSACISNQEEYERSRSVVLFHTVTPEPEWFYEGANRDEDMEKVLESTELWNARGDAYLEKSYGLFLKNLRKNLQLDNQLVSTIDSLHGPVGIQSFAIYNRYNQLDEEGNLKEYRIVRYSHVGEDSWQVTAYPINTPAECYNSLSKQNEIITESSIAATLVFQLEVPYRDLENNMRSEKITNEIVYTRIVDIKDGL